MNGVVVGAFGGHCDLFNYTGMLVAVSTTPFTGISQFSRGRETSSLPIRCHLNLCDGIESRSSGGGDGYYEVRSRKVAKRESGPEGWAWPLMGIDCSLQLGNQLTHN
jgi:hypothetical protein